MIEKVAVLIPARDEEHDIGATISSAQVQEGVDHLQIHVLDDGSHDATAAIAQALAHTDPRVHVHEEPDEAPPAGWLGKNYACARLAELSEGGQDPFAQNLRRAMTAEEKRDRAQAERSALSSMVWVFGGLTVLIVVVMLVMALVSAAFGSVF